ncbi:MAG: U32 family peptidase [Bacilli bacterium]|nr:U32 family peptidase [Bacilli bacterium]
MKKLLMPSSIEQINRTFELTDGYILSLKNFSVNAPFYFEMSDIKKIINSLKNKKIFISINKNIHENELDELKEYLNELSNLDIDGILYADASIVEINSKLEKKLNLFWANEHVTTNYMTCNFLSNFDICGVLISPELSLREIIEIKNNTKLNCMAYIFGYLPMFVSFRHTVQNYYDFNNYNNQEGIHKIYKEDKFYPIIDNKNGSEAYSNFVLNGVDEFKKLDEVNFDYGIFNSLLIEEEKMIDVLKIYDNGKKEDLEKIIDNTDTGFFYKETVYKVK